jgi:hypothetical protein
MENQIEEPEYSNEENSDEEEEEIENGNSD